jgi:hypothetical protein
MKETMNLVLDSDIHKIDEKRKLLVVHTQIFNRGNVSIKFVEQGKKKCSFILEVRKIDIPSSSDWIDPEKMKVVNKIDLLKDFEEEYLIESNTSNDEVRSIPLENGFYQVTVTITYNDGETIDQSIVVNLNEDDKKK